jgi:hypothetical protein
MRGQRRTRRPGRLTRPTTPSSGPDIVRAAFVFGPDPPGHTERLFSAFLAIDTIKKTCESARSPRQITDERSFRGDIERSHITP